MQATTRVTLAVWLCCGWRFHVARKSDASGLGSGKSSACEVAGVFHGALVVAGL